MSRYLAYTSPARGHLYPIVPMLSELRTRGHEVSLRTLASEVRALNEIGIATVPIDKSIEAIKHSDWRARTPVGGIKRGRATFSERAPLDLADLQRQREMLTVEQGLQYLLCGGEDRLARPLLLGLGSAPADAEIQIDEGVLGPAVGNGVVLAADRPNAHGPRLEQAGAKRGLEKAFAQRADIDPSVEIGGILNREMGHRHLIIINELIRIGQHCQCAPARHMKKQGGATRCAVPWNHRAARQSSSAICLLKPWASGGGARKPVPGHARAGRPNRSVPPIPVRVRAVFPAAWSASQCRTGG
jgi:hypothetical protein